MKNTLHILMLLVGAGYAAAVFAGVTGLAPSLTFATSDTTILLYTVIGSMLISLVDYSPRRPIVLRSAEIKAPRVVSFGVSRRGLHHGSRIAA